MAGSRNLIAIPFVAVIPILIILSPQQAWWSILLMVLTFTLAGWPVRRALFAETWSFGAYLWFYVRLVLGIYGFWLTLLAAPSILRVSSLRGWIAAAVLGIVLLVWFEFYGAFLRTLMRTKTVTTPALVDRFNAIIAKTTVAPPNVEYVDMRGGSFVNALALPDSRRSSVLYTSTLLERFDEDEIAAIFAHEVSHLEFYNPPYLNKWGAIGRLVIVLTVSITPISQQLQQLEWLASWWFVVIFVYMAVRGPKQKHETESDLRAVALTGDPEVMVRALVKLHELMKMPRRMDPTIEANATHPSLARRIQAIRSASGSAVPTIAEPITFTHESTSVTLHADRLVWTEGDVTAYTFAYPALNELRLHADAKGAMRLIASDPAGRKWTLPLADADVPRAHAALNLVDVHLRSTPVGGGTKLPIPLVRWLAVLAAIFAASATQYAAVLVGILAAISAERPLLRAAAAASFATALLAALYGYGQAAFTASLLIPATALLYVAWHDKREVVSRTAWRFVDVIGIFAVLLLIPIALAGPHWLPLHQAARLWPSTIVMSIAFAVANWPRRAAAWRIATAAATIVGIVCFVLGSTFVLNLGFNDPFYSNLAVSTAVPLPATAEARFNVGVIPQRLLLSPSATSIVAITEDEDEEYVFNFGRRGAVLIATHADDGLFVDDDRLLVFHTERGDTTLRLLHVDRPDAIWEKTIKIFPDSLSISGDRRQWELLGTGAGDTFVRVSGNTDGSGDARREWPDLKQKPDDADVEPILAGDDRLLLRQSTWHRVGLFSGNSTLETWIDPWHTDDRFIQIDDQGQRELMRSAVDVNCEQGAVSNEAAICWGYDGTNSHIFTMNAEGRLQPIAVRSGRMGVHVTRGWITGWANSPFAIHIETGNLYQVERNRGAISADGEWLAVVSARDKSAAVDLYRITAR